jgi:DNA-binding CsgD family transcriptional regulator/PAS domain-containing protein
MTVSPDRSKPSRDEIQFSDRLARSVFDALSAHIAILDHNGVILATNRAWHNHSVLGGMPPEYDYRGSNYLSTCDLTRGADSDEACMVASGIRAVIDKELDEFLHDYPCHRPDGQHWFYMRVIRIPDTDPVVVVVSHEEITALKLTEEALRESQEDLKEQKQSLEEANVALKVLLKQREEDKTELEKRFLTNVKGLVLPYVEKLKSAPLKPKSKTLVEIIDTHLQDIITPLMQNLTNANILLTPQEMQVASLVKDGKTSKEIAEILFVSEATVNFHRKNLRTKFGLTNKQTNLRAYLMSIS